MERPGIYLVVALLGFFLLSLLLMPKAAGTNILDRIKGTPISSTSVPAENVIITITESDKDGKIIKTQQASLLQVISEFHSILNQMNERIQILEALQSETPITP